MLVFTCYLPKQCLLWPTCLPLSSL